MDQHTPAIPSQEWKEQLTATVAVDTQSGNQYTFESVAVSDKALLEMFGPLGSSDMFLAVYKVKEIASLQKGMFCSTEVEEMYGPLVSTLYVTVDFDEQD
ncbi:hypothetical protein MTO96_012791 [Rhipicephalus appendiculatus]